MNEPPPQAAPHAWDRAVVGWHAAFWVVLALTALALFADGGTTGRRAVVGVVVLVALGLAYLLLGAPAARDRSQRRALGYVGVLVVALPVLLWVDGGTSFLLFLAYPQVWLLVDGRLRAALATAVVSLAALVGVVLGAGGDSVSLRGAGIAVLVSFGFSLTLGLWISSIIEQSAERADLIGRLEATRAELAAAERAAGAAQVQASMARDIHDTLAQGFTSVLMLAQVAAREARPDEHAVRARLATLEEVARTNLAEARALVAASSPVAVHGTDLAGAVSRLAERFSRETGVRVVVDLDPDLDSAAGRPGAAGATLSPELAVVLLRSAQEGLANVRKHSGATTVTVRLRGRPGSGLALEVLDDGVGCPPGVPGEGFGLDGLRARAREVGGSVDLSTGPDGGARLTVDVPSPGRSQAPTVPTGS